jgi:hypothetical protein
MVKFELAGPFYSRINPKTAFKKGRFERGGRCTVEVEKTDTATPQIATIKFSPLFASDEIKLKPPLEHCDHCGLVNFAMHAKWQTS